MRRLALVPFALLLGACGSSGASDDTGIEVVDSAGIQLVRNDGASVPVVLEPDLTIGTVDGPEELQFFRVSALAIAADGAVFVGDGSGSIRQFDAAGGFVRSFGRRGAGPGEFERPVQIHLYGDTIAVVDAGHYRITELDSAGTVLLTTPYRAERTIASPVARLDGGWLIQTSELGWNLEVGRPWRGTVRLMHAPGGRPLVGADADSSTAQARPVASYLSGRIYGIDSEMGGMTANSPLWEPEPAHAADASGNVYVSLAAEYRIDVYNAEGVLWRRITREHDPVPVTDELTERYWEKVNLYLDTTTNKHGEWPITVDAERGRAALPVNEALPVLGRLIVSADGMLWASRPDLSPDPLRLEWTREGTAQDTFWDVFDHEGRFVMTVRLPASFRPRAAADRAIYGVLRDELDVEHIARFTLPPR